MNKIKLLYHYFSRPERTLWCSSVLLILLSFIIFDRENFLTLAASLIGVTSLIFNAKGNPFGQLLMVVFSLLYGIISFTFAYSCQRYLWICELETDGETTDRADVSGKITTS